MKFSENAMLTCTDNAQFQTVIASLSN